MVLILFIVFISLSTLVFIAFYLDRSDIEGRWGYLCAYFDNKMKLKLYVADTPQKHSEGYMFKESIDFENIGAEGMVFINLTIVGSYITFTMKNVKFNLLLVELVPANGYYVVDDIVLMEPGKLYTVGTSPGSIFIEVDPKYMDLINKGLKAHIGDC